MQAPEVARKKAEAMLVEFGSRLEQGYRAAGLSGSDLALLAGLKQPRVSKLVNGITGLETPAFIALIRAALDCGINADWLFFGREPKAGRPSDATLKRLDALKIQSEAEQLEELERQRKALLRRQAARQKSGEVSLEDERSVRGRRKDG